MDPTAIKNPDLWAQLGPAGGILAFIVTVLWMAREVMWAKRETEWQNVVKDLQAGYTTQLKETRELYESRQTELKMEATRQWQMLSDLTRTASDDLIRVIERSTQAWAEVRTLLDARNTR